MRNHNRDTDSRSRIKPCLTSRSFVELLTEDEQLYQFAFQVKKDKLSKEFIEALLIDYNMKANNTRGITKYADLFVYSQGFPSQNENPPNLFNKPGIE